MHMDILPAYIFVYHTCAWSLRRPEEGLDSLELELRTAVSNLNPWAIFSASIYLVIEAGFHSRLA